MFNPIYFFLCFKSPASVSHSFNMPSYILKFILELQLYSNFIYDRLTVRTLQNSMHLIICNYMSKACILVSHTVYTYYLRTCNYPSFIFTNMNILYPIIMSLYACNENCAYRLNTSTTKQYSCCV